ncbi:hypothetical protein [Bradyrhizobium erythrophlei]|jgi:hypothetical protein|uniref:Cytochrome c domain-containing protein n=1 Tax=Bradyrhizobium erythrophlei TaxID=1437360 RepID=A0A1M5GBM1_9BRAD|nr:hypothetical protein [Bradyrhizobium erythrophlei]SHG01114.1 hypothetical protein SAMN05444169_0041 [Bradyrhizobium erythrophlei]
MTHTASRTNAIHFKTIAGACAVAAVLLAGSPAFATQLARHDAHCAACRQDAEPRDHRPFGTSPSHEIDAPRLNRHATHHDWPANMILG